MYPKQLFFTLEDVGVTSQCEKITTEKFFLVKYDEMIGDLF